MEKKNFRVLKLLNNNIILAFDLDNKEEVILLGKGIGFGKKENKKAYIPRNSIEKSFVTYDDKMTNDYFKIVNSTDSKVIEISEKIIDSAEKKLGDLNSHIHILLTDHIGFAIERVNSGLEITNPFIDEINILYPEEFKIASEGISIIKENLDIDLGRGEVGFIAMHLHSAKKNVNVKETVKSTRILNEIVNIIEDGLNIKIKKTDYEYKRLINHLQGALDRIKNKKTIKNPLLSNIKEQFKDSFEIIEKIKEKIEEEYETEVLEEELGYMAIHIERLKK
ncbi:PRD domain-containing protein [Tepidibacter aestuarii]|uniref:PRD domain-containing protein n=1 Tax=Tepidibacter aestuarii TaxID=2925782 RepID=UPI0020BFCB0C|nr:PRD domain-containing protein [Tepidibacter aestuarii]CAH2214650.1 transcriptional antiterminator [Tepidibacter aestuarii]